MIHCSLGLAHLGLADHARALLHRDRVLDDVVGRRRARGLGGGGIHHRGGGCAGDCARVVHALRLAPRGLSLAAHRGHLAANRPAERCQKAAARGCARLCPHRRAGRWGPIGRSSRGEVLAGLVEGRGLAHGDGVGGHGAAPRTVGPHLAGLDAALAHLRLDVAGLAHLVHVCSLGELGPDITHAALEADLLANAADDSAGEDRSGAHGAVLAAGDGAHGHEEGLVAGERRLAANAVERDAVLGHLAADGQRVQPARAAVREAIATGVQAMRWRVSDEDADLSCIRAVVELARLVQAIDNRLRAVAAALGAQGIEVLPHGLGALRELVHCGDVRALLWGVVAVRHEGEAHIGLLGAYNLLHDVLDRLLRAGDVRAHGPGRVHHEHHVQQCGLGELAAQRGHAGLLLLALRGCTCGCPLLGRVCGRSGHGRRGGGGAVCNRSWGCDRLRGGGVHGIAGSGGLTGAEGTHACLLVAWK
eukprot:m.224266 g.224266  ORF g.224266 m.224266 type:complete len:476 (+) comp11068_c0_seq1:170-1597(+)